MLEKSKRNKSNGLGTKFDKTWNRQVPSHDNIHVWNYDSGERGYNENRLRALKKQREANAMYYKIRTKFQLQLISVGCEISADQTHQGDA